jgi:transcriptional regulator with XRE-family HTH domain
VAETFGERLARLRDEAGMTVSGLAHAIHRSEGTIRKLESGASKEPRATVALLLARALGVTAWYLVFGDADPQQRELRSQAARIEALEHRVFGTIAPDRHGYTSAAPDDDDRRRTAPRSR